MKIQENLSIESGKEENTCAARKLALRDKEGIEGHLLNK